MRALRVTAGNGSLLLASAVTAGLAIHAAPCAPTSPLAIPAISALLPNPAYVDVLVADHATGDAARLLAQYPEFGHWARVPSPAGAAGERFAIQLAHLPGVVEAYLEPTYSLPDHGDRPAADLAPIDGETCPITTPSYEQRQGYLGPAPGGIDAAAAWRRGALGAGVWFADVEGNWNANHEDLDGSRITHLVGERQTGPGWRAHGTAVLGEVVGLDNGKGVIGIAPATERVFTASFARAGVGGAIDAAAHAMRPGDVLLIELQGTGPRGRFLPVEFWDDAYDAIHAATDRGIVVIEAAGNGAENLDHAAYGGKFDRKHRDSGAILVGAGGPPRAKFNEGRGSSAALSAAEGRGGAIDRQRLDFSNYGGRVDVQGWGRGVATLDYGDLQRCDDDLAHRHYTDAFSGTSSASPIVAGAAILLESAARSRGTWISPRDLRALLVATGSPQVGSRAKQEPIGPRPDLARAFAAH